MGFVATSLGLHLLALNVLGPSGRPILIEPPNPPLQWVELTPAGTVEAAPQPVRMSRAASRPRRDRDATPTTSAQGTSPSAPVPEQTPPPRLAIADLRTSARAIAREEPGREKSAAENGPTEVRSILPQLDRALRREPAGEHRLANGLIRVMSAGGRVCCLQPPPEFARGGPVETLSVPTTCP